MLEIILLVLKNYIQSKGVILMNYNEIINFDTGNCHGISVTLFVSGCHLHCPECHNKQTWDFNSGKLFTNDTIEEILDKLKSPHISYFVLDRKSVV